MSTGHGWRPGPAEPITGTPLRELVRTRMLDLLARGELAPGADLSEKRLAEAFGISRSPLREALLLLSHEGHIENKPNRGFFVPVPDPERVCEIYPVLALMEQMALRGTGEAAFDLAPELAVLNAGVIDPSHDERQRSEADQSFHRLLLSKCPNGFLMKQIEHARTSARLSDGGGIRNMADQTGSHHQHEAIIEALASKDLDQAVAELATHWRQGHDVVLDWIEAHRLDC